MRCSRRSTTWLGSALALLLACTGTLGAVPASQGAANEDVVRAAIVEAVRSRVGDDADVRIEALTVKATLTGEDRIVATPEPAGRLGLPMRFALSRRSGESPGQSWAAGHAVATVTVTATCVRVVRPIPAGTLLSADDVTGERADLGSVALQRPPAAADAVGARANRALKTGELILASAISSRRLVRSGETVTVRYRAEGFEIEARGVAAQSGGIGDVIRVVNPGSRRALDARIVGAGEVEVIR